MCCMKWCVKDERAQPPGSKLYLTLYNGVCARVSTLIDGLHNQCDVSIGEGNNTAIYHIRSVQGTVPSC